MKIVAGLLLFFAAAASAQTVPNGGIVQGQIWSVPQWVSAWQSKTDIANGFLVGNQAPVSGGAMQVDKLLEPSSPIFPIASEGSIWSSTAYAYNAFSATVSAGTVPGQGFSGPLVGTFTFLNNNGATAPAVANVSDCVARVAGTTCFGANFIARNALVNGTKLVGLEIDVEPATGTTISSNSVGLVFNMFSIASPAPVVLVGGVAGGTWANGFLTSRITGAHFAVASGDPTTAASFIDSRNGTFSNTAIVTGTGAGQGWNIGGGSFGTSPFIYADGGGNLLVNTGTAGTVIFQKPSGATEWTFDQFGAVTSAGAMAIKTNGSAAINISTGQVVSTVQPLQLPNYTVATLPACNAAIQYSLAVVTDATAPTYNAALTGGGAVKIPVFCTGAAWTAH